MKRTGSVSYNLPVTIIKEGDSFVAYSPVIDLSTVGKSPQEAQDRFQEAAEIFFAELITHNKLDVALLELGWQINEHELFPPEVVSSQVTSISLPSSVIYA